MTDRSCHRDRVSRRTQLYINSRRTERNPYVIRMAEFGKQMGPNDLSSPPQHTRYLDAPSNVRSPFVTWAVVCTGFDASMNDCAVSLNVGITTVRLLTGPGARERGSPGRIWFRTVTNADTRVGAFLPLVYTRGWKTLDNSAAGGEPHGNGER